MTKWPDRWVACGLVVVAVYAALAAWSGWLSPLARSPLLDGTIPGAAYRWVSPPADLAANNVPPSAGDFTLRLGDSGSAPQVLLTPDDQVTIVAQEGSVPPASDQREVRIRVRPLDPATLGPPPGDLAPFGNAYRLESVYRPSGEPAAPFEPPMFAILVYPATPDLHATEHVLLFSDDGDEWTELSTEDSVGRQQAEAEVQRQGLLMVAGVPAVLPEPPGATSSGGSRALSTVLLVVAACTLLIGIGLLLRGRGRE